MPLPEPSLWSLLREDLETYERSLAEGGLWVTALHRIAARTGSLKPSILRGPARMTLRALIATTSRAFGIRFAPETRLGRRVRIWHTGGIRLNATSIGDDVHLRPNTTCGAPPGAPDDPQHWPTIGSRADLGAGACVLGHVMVGENAIVGANTVVMDDVPPNGVMLGIPGRLLPHRPPSASNKSAPGRVLGQHDQNPQGISLGDLIAEDFRTHGSHLSSPGFWALAVHRIGNWRMRIDSKLLRTPVTVAYRTSFHAISWLWGIDLSYVVKVGRRVRLDHHGSIMIGAESIGDDVVIRHSVVIGVMRRDAPGDKPSIGDRVELGPRSCIVGNVTIGHDTLVCANTVVPANIPPHSTVLGVPGRIVALSKHLSAPLR